jgi:hypothetical protein
MFALGTRTRIQQCAINREGTVLGALWQRFYYGSVPVVRRNQNHLARAAEDW